MKNNKTDTMQDKTDWKLKLLKMFEEYQIEGKRFNITHVPLWRELIKEVETLLEDQKQESYLEGRHDALNIVDEYFYKYPENYPDNIQDLWGKLLYGKPNNKDI